MTDLVLPPLLMAWLVSLAVWRRVVEPDLVLAACVLAERLCGPRPAAPGMGVTNGRLVAGLTVRDTRWGRANYPATHPLKQWVVAP